MEYSCLPSTIKLLAYSFESDHGVFMNFLDLLKNECLKIFGKGFDLVVLLDAITELEIS
jgi:superoxide dismutase